MLFTAPPPHGLRHPERQRARYGCLLRCRATSERPASATTTLRNLENLLEATSPTPVVVVVPEQRAPTPPPTPPVPAPPRIDDTNWLSAPFPVPWGLSTLVYALVGVELCVLSSGFLSTLLLVGLPSERAVTVEELQALLSEPAYFWRNVLISESLFAGSSAALLFFLLKPHYPLPSGCLALLPPEPKGGASSTSQGVAAASPSSTSTPSWLGLAAGSAALALAASAAASLLGLRAAQEGAASNSLIAGAAAGGPPGIATLVVCTVMVAPVLEEVVFRGVLLSTLTKWMPPPAAIAVSALVFAAIHQQGSGDAVQLASLGVATGLIYCRTRSLLAPIAVHALFNGSVLALYALWTSK